VTHIYWVSDGYRELVLGQVIDNIAAMSKEVQQPCRFCL